MNVYPLNLTLTDSSDTVTQLPVNIQVVSGGYGTEDSDRSRIARA